MSVSPLTGLLQMCYLEKKTDSDLKEKKKIYMEGILQLTYGSINKSMKRILSEGD